MTNDFAVVEPNGKLEHRLEGMGELIDAIRQLAKSLPVSTETDDATIIVLTGFVDQASIDPEVQFRFSMAFRDIITLKKNQLDSIVGRRVKITIESDKDSWKYGSTGGY